MIMFIPNNAKNTNNEYIFFNLKYEYYSYTLFKEDTNLCLDYKFVYKPEKKRK